jgi:hypothetical protein
VTRARGAAHALALVTAVHVAGVLLAGCDALGFTHRCRLGDEHVVQLTTAKEIDAIALQAAGDGAVALWSEPSGAYARRLDRKGRPAGKTVALGARCAGGLAVASLEHGGLVLACSQLPRGEAHGAVRVALLDSTLRVTRANELARVGAQSEGIDVVRIGGRIELAWHDGSAEVQRVWRASLAADGAQVDAPRPLSDPAHVASAPAIGVADAAIVVTWSERFMDGDALRTTVVRWDARAGVRTLVARAHIAAMPQLVTLGERLVLAVRDRPRDAKIGLYLAIVGDQAVRPTELVRVGRADGVGRPALEPCLDGLVSATPRTYGGDYFIGFNWLNGELRRTRGEQQFYEDSHAFTQVAASCVKSHALLLIAEFPQLHRETAALRALPYVCD